MTMELLIGYAVLWIVLLKTLLMRAHVIPADCARCGLRFERQELGQAICCCDRP
jgi:predicted Zn-ribbon and HTH transcriptional regulator